MTKVFSSLTEQKVEDRKANLGLLAFVLFAVILLFCAYILNNFVYKNIQVVGDSMSPTLYGGSVELNKTDGDYLLANTLRKAKKGDIIIIGGVKNCWLIKRVIATGGDTVEIKDGYVYVNGEKIEENYLSIQGVTRPYDKATWQLQENEIFYLGDNRENSADARHNGPCTVDNVVGVVENWSLELRGVNKFLHKFSIRGIIDLF